MWKFLTIAVLFIITGAVRAANPGDEVVVIYNRRMPESKVVAEHYAERRHVPANQVFGFSMTTNETMSRAEYHNSLEKPLAKELEGRKLWHISSDITHPTNGAKGKVVWEVKQSKIRYAVLCYGVPLRIDNDPSIKEEPDPAMNPALLRNGAAVDSELALLPCIEQNLPLLGPKPSTHYGLTNAASFNPASGILMVTRLDGPSAEIANGLVDKAMEAETNGLCGRAYFDCRNLPTNSPYRMGDDWILGAAKICAYFGGFDTFVDENPETFPAGFPMSQIGIYCGWYDGDASGPFAQKTVEFMPGAFAYHLQSFSAATLRSTTKQWVGPLLAKGAAATMGCVDEPYISGTPDVAIFCARWIALGFTFGEAAYASQQTLSWQTTVVGDPLYRPFDKPLQALLEEQQRTQNKAIEWSYLRAININVLRGRPRTEASRFLQSLPATKASAVLSEKLAESYDAQGMPSSTVETYESALKLDPSPLQRVRIRMNLANKLTALGKTNEASADLKALLTEEPDYPGRANVEKKLQELANKPATKEAASTAPSGTNP
jgi:uncharacterized protein (TIGR03790 family)